VRGGAALDAVTARFSDPDDLVRATAIAAALEIVGPRADTKPVRGQPKPKAPDQALAARFSETASKSRFADVRLAAALRLDDVTDPAADGLLVGLFGDRSADVRARAVTSYANRVEKKGASTAPLVDVVRGGARETMLPAAIGLAHRRDPKNGADGALAFRPLLLFVRAGEGGERERALLALGALGDGRALGELETIASGGTEEAPVDEPMQAAAVEALGRLFPHLSDEESKERVRDRIEANVASKAMAMAVAAAKGLRFVGDGRSRARLEGILASGETSAERLAAAEGLGELADAGSEMPLGKALKDRDYDVRQAARASLDRLFPKDRTRVELLAVESDHEDLSKPAAAFLAAEADAAELVAKLAKISNGGLRHRLRYGLARRAALPGLALAKLLRDGTVSSRSDAAWIVGVGLSAVPEGERAELAKALLHAVVIADEARRDALRRGKVGEASAEAQAEVRALWAARRLDAVGLGAVAQRILGDADAPNVVRIEALRGLGADASEALSRALADSDLRVRLEAASSLGAANTKLESLERAPKDPVVLSRVVRGRQLPVTPLDSADRRRILVPLALTGANLASLLAHAGKAKAEGRLEAIAELGLSGAPEAIGLLAKLAAKGLGEPEDVRKTAYRALRRAQRRLASRPTTKEVRP
jgi:ParB family chromosome partitioning protein